MSFLKNIKYKTDCFDVGLKFFKKVLGFTKNFTVCDEAKF